MPLQNLPKELPNVQVSDTTDDDSSNSVDSIIIFSTLMIYRSIAPLRIGLAGGGTDVSPYSDLYGGAILNATISLYAHATLEPLPDKRIILTATDRQEELVFDWSKELPINGKLDLLKGVYNRIQKDHASQDDPVGRGLSGGFRLSTHV